MLLKYSRRLCNFLWSELGSLIDQKKIIIILFVFGLYAILNHQYRYSLVMCICWDIEIELHFYLFMFALATGTALVPPYAR